jgi:A/G-specific adenine glycosylase
LGAYTSAAVAAIAFGEPAAAVDTNVARVVARLHALRRPAPGEIDRLVLGMIPPGRAGDFTQAMMDLGATICRPRNPRCADCPLAPDCLAFANGEPAAYPEPKVRAARPHRFGIAYWIEQCGSVWLVRRPPRGVFGGMAALPGPEWTEQAAASVNALGTVRHVFTHFSLDLAIVPRADPEGEGWWQPLDGLADAGLPTLYRRAADLALTARSAA